MNFVKRAGHSLWARKAGTAALAALFTVICALLLGGSVLRAAAERQEADARREIGVDVTVRDPGLTAALADRLGAAPQVHRYTPSLPVGAEGSGVEPLDAGEPSPDAAVPEPEPPFALLGVRDSGLLLPFSYGSSTLRSGRGITPQDADAEVAVIERRLAERNGLEVGDTIRLRPAGGGPTLPLTVVGVHQDTTPDPAVWTPPHELPGNQLYVPVAVAERLGAGTAEPVTAVYRIGSPDQAEALHAEAGRLLGADPSDVRVNDRAYRDQVLPLQRVGAFAGLTVRVITVAGTVILGLVVLLRIRERRAELGVLLSLGEPKPKLIAQHTVEVAAVALPAVALATVACWFTAGPLAAAAGSLTAVPRVVTADLVAVSGIALGISVLATAVPGIAILRLHPRSLLLDTD